MSSAFEDRNVRRTSPADWWSPLSPGAAELDPRDDFGAVTEVHYPAVYRAVRGVVLDPDVAEDDGVR